MWLLPGAWAAAEERFFAAETGSRPDQYLVMFTDDAVRGPDDEPDVGPSVEEVAAELADLYGGSVERTWKHALKGFQIRISEADAQRLAFDPAVRWVQQDRNIGDPENLTASCYGWDFQTQAAAEKAVQSIDCDDPDPRNPNGDCIDNWGLDRVDQTSGERDGLYNYTDFGHLVHVFVLDTGILAQHDDFFVPGPPFTRVINGYNAIQGGDPTFTTDCHGHGTHVAGIIGGSTSGVAKYVWLRPVKFLDRCPNPDDPTGPDPPRGGNVSDVIEGLNWIFANHDTDTNPAVINWSGGNGSAGSSPFSLDPAVQVAVANLLAADFTFVQSAGNQLDDINGQPTDACARSLGGVPGLGDVIVVGGTDTNPGELPVDGRWIREIDDPSYDEICNHSVRDCGSNSGSCVDIWAPAAHIVSASAEDDSEFCRLSGTSMAAPHVSGAAALYLEDHFGASPNEVADAIIAGATCDVLDVNPTSPYYIGDGSPNLMLNTLFNGGGPNGCNRPPVCQDDEFSTLRDIRLPIPFGALRINDSDPDGDPLWVTYDSTTTQGGMNDSGHLGGFNYMPPSGFTGIDTFEYTISDRPDETGLTDTCTVTVNVLAPDHALTVSVAGTGSGTVTSSPSGISCPGDCSNDYTEDTEVVLSAQPSPGSEFAGWSGDSDCHDGVVTMSSDRSCTASFEPLPLCYVPPVSGDWLVTEDCTLVGAVTAPANVIVENGATLVVASNTSLDVDFAQYRLLTRDGGRVAVEGGGRIH